MVLQKNWTQLKSKQHTVAHANLTHKASGTQPQPPAAVYRMAPRLTFCYSNYIHAFSSPVKLCASRKRSWPENPALFHPSPHWRGCLWWRRPPSPAAIRMEASVTGLGKQCKWKGHPDEQNLCDFDCGFWPRI